MKASLNWIREFVDLPTTDPDEIGEALSILGIEVEAMERLEIPFSGVVIARVLQVEQHPDADRIRLATLDAGGDPIRVVCGAWNFEAGATVAYAAVGAVLAGGLEVGERDIRGVMSPGMICSEAEMGIGEDADGILVLEGGDPGADFGSTLAYPDVIFDLSITPNRPDAMSIHGIARDLAAYYDVAAPRPESQVIESGSPTEASVTIEEPDLCTRFTAREIRDVAIGPSPLWMRLRLRDAGVRPIGNVVDITNYVMLEYGQPLHAFDLDLLPGEQIIVRKAKEGERLTTLDDVERALDPDDLLIAGLEGGLGLAGVMGGGSSEVSESTRRVLLEVAHFEPGGVLLTGKRHALRTEAVARFERDVDPELPPVASARAAALMVEHAGGTAAPGFIDEHPTPWSAPRVTLRDGEVERILGVAVTPDEAAGYLRRLGFGVEGTSDLEVTVPSYRPDVTRPADLIEEVARIHGYDRIPSRLPKGVAGEIPPWLRTERWVRDVFIGAGFYEVWNFDFLGIEDIELLGLPLDHPWLDPVRIRNPLNEEQAYLRPSLLPGLLRGLARNRSRSSREAALFEIGAVFAASDDELPSQPHRVAFAASGPVPGLSYEERPERDGRDAIGMAAVLLGSIPIRFDLEQVEEPGFHPGRCARLLVDGVVIGTIGEIHPGAVERFGLAGRVAAGEFDMAALEKPSPVEFTTPSSLPPLEFDLAFDLAAEVAAADLVTAVGAAAGPDLESIEIFDVFTGPPIEEGRKSIAVRLAFRNPERTLTDEELAPVRERIAGSVADGLGGILRGG